MKSDKKLAIFWFRWVGYLGISLSLAFFLLYSSGLIRSKVKPLAIAENWSKETPIYLEEMGLEFGSGWLIHIEDLYSMNVAAIAILVSAALPALLALSFIWYRKRDFLFGTMAIAISAVLVIAIIGFR
ncbi:hypothetical protein S1OALGB6SA_1255 [Olavius algarvensis spirochete endosymbiont]|uniref:hypothetical protein n=1 Tax=Olavius algarvensis spirochete endosymbiont TaxID=260710 RepID=UPI000F0D8E43|nr:hypothetical protein [Olavius algarvensis spirochete endosymbiont]VDB00180.1 hypothetical protein S1OALGB6SA_1255 [Olavius algarvensis spirochete endosymbiont]